MADCDDAIRRALVQLNMHYIIKEMIASHVLIFMPSLLRAGKKLMIRYNEKIGKRVVVYGTLLN